MYALQEADGSIPFSSTVENNNLGVNGKSSNPEYDKIMIIIQKWPGFEAQVRVFFL